MDAFRKLLKGNSPESQQERDKEQGDKGEPKLNPREMTEKLKNNILEKQRRDKEYARILAEEEKQQRETNAERGNLHETTGHKIEIGAAEKTNDDDNEREAAQQTTNDEESGRESPQTQETPILVAVQNHQVVQIQSRPDYKHNSEEETMDYAYRFATQNTPGPVLSQDSQTRNVAPHSKPSTSKGCSPQSKPGTSKECSPQSKPGNSKGCSPQSKPGTSKGCSPQSTPSTSKGCSPQSKPSTSKGCSPQSKPGTSKGCSPQSKPGTSKGCSPQSKPSTSKERNHFGLNLKDKLKNAFGKKKKVTPTEPVMPERNVPVVEEDSDVKDSEAATDLTIGKFSQTVTGYQVGQSVATALGAEVSASGVGPSHTVTSLPEVQQLQLPPKHGSSQCSSISSGLKSTASDDYLGDVSSIEESTTLKRTFNQLSNDTTQLQLYDDPDQAASKSPKLTPKNDM